MSQNPTGQKFLIVITGPTAVGKTSISLKIAENYNAEILSADSRQIFKEINIGTASPSDSVLSRVPHHFVNVCELDEYYSAGKYESAALEILDQLYKKSDYSILCGGTGLYIKAVLEGFDKLPEVPTEILETLEAEFHDTGLEPLVKELLTKDPIYASKADLKNPRRVMRALSVCRSADKPYSSYLGKKSVKRPFHIIPLLLMRPKEELHLRIETRVGKMFTQGLIGEVMKLGDRSDLRSLQTVGYPEVFSHLAGKLTLEEAQIAITTKTKQYAKRQGTYNRKNFPWPVFHPDEKNRIFEYIETCATNLNP